MIFPKSPHPDRPIFVQPGAGDMRKQINGLAVMVQNIIGQNPFIVSPTMLTLLKVTL